MKPFLLALVVLSTLSSLKAEELRTVGILRHGIVADAAGTENFAALDISGDGTYEVVGCSIGAPFAIGAVDGTFGVVWRGPAVGCRGIATGDTDRDGAPEIVVVGAEPDNAGSVINVFDPRSWGPAGRSVLVPDVVLVDVAVGNVDADSATEIIAVSAEAAYVFDGQSLALQWRSAGRGGTEVRLGDVDGDTRLEIVVNGPTGYVLDGANETFKWGWVGGFDYTFALGNLDNDAKAEIVYGGSSTSVTILHGDTFATSTFEVGGASALSVGNADGSGGNEIIVGDGNYGVSGWRPDGVKAWDIIHNSDPGAVGVILADLDGDGPGEILWGAGGATSGRDVILIGNPRTGLKIWELEDLDPTFSSATGDLDGDGTVEYVVASGGSRSGYDGAVLEVFDVVTRRSKGLVDMAQFADLDLNKIAIGQLDSDPQLEILALGSIWYDPVLVSWDGLSREVEWSTTTGSYNGFTRAALLVENIDGDAVDEIVVGTSPPGLTVLNGASNVIQWSGPLPDIVLTLDAADLNGVTGPELVVGMGSGVMVMSPLNWSTLGSVELPGTRAAAGTNAAGGMVAVAHTTGYYYSPSTISFYQGAALTFVRSCPTVDSYEVEALRFGEIGDETHLVVAERRGSLYAYAAAEDSCPTTLTGPTGLSEVNELKFEDVTGDGRAELIVDRMESSELLFAGTSRELRGDVDGDGLITADDVESLVGFLFGTSAGTSTSADANVDGRIGVEDAFVLINHEFANGAAPQP